MKLILERIENTVWKGENAGFKEPSWRRVLKTMWEKEKMLLTTIFSFFHNVFTVSRTEIIILVTNCFLYGNALNLVFVFCDGLVVRISAWAWDYGFDPQPWHTKVFRTGRKWPFPLALRILGMALRLAHQCQDNGLVKYWLKRNSPENMDLWSSLLNNWNTVVMA